MTHLLTSAWCKRIQACNVFVQKDDILNILGLIQMFVYVFAIRKKNQVISSKGPYFYIMQLPIRLNCSD